MKEKLLKKTKLLLIGIVLLGALFRFYDLNWDQGQHLHPDERAIVLAVNTLHIPQTMQQFLSTNSTWNPHFFAYGSFPMYLLYIVGNLMGIVNPLFAHYDWINIAGRLLSALFDTALIIMLFKIGKKTVNETIGLLASFFYAVSVLPIQLSHFYAVDTLLTLLITTALYQLMYFSEKATIKRALFIGVLMGLAVSTKISAVVLLVPIAIVLLIDFLQPFWKQQSKQHWHVHLIKTLRYTISYMLIMGGTTMIVFVICEPYAFLDFQEFWIQNQQQAAMTKDAFVFPYTLQYVGIIPYWYEIKNIFLWGMGPVLALVTLLGTVYITIAAGISKTTKETWIKEMILLSFFWVYFAIVGHFAVGFMRYMLPVYPILCLFGAQAINKTVIDWSLPKIRFLFIPFSILFAVLFLYWPVSFMHIYTQPNTRVLATNYINQHIPARTGIAIEHWDDELPLGTGSYYQVQTLALYDPDTQNKWIQIVDQLKQVQYIIISSNRLYVPIQKLNNCNKYPFPRCYPVASIYYKNLFAGKPILQGTPLANLPGANSLLFKEVKQYSISPEIPLLNIPINDQSADESFTVYDHAKVMIFKKASLL